MEVPHKSEDEVTNEKQSPMQTVFYIAMGILLIIQTFLYFIGIYESDNILRDKYLDRIQGSLILSLWAEVYWFKK